MVVVPTENALPINNILIPDFYLLANVLQNDGACVQRLIPVRILSRTSQPQQQIAAHNNILSTVPWETPGSKPSQQPQVLPKLNELILKLRKPQRIDQEEEHHTPEFEFARYSKQSSSTNILGKREKFSFPDQGSGGSKLLKTDLWDKTITASEVESNSLDSEAKLTAKDNHGSNQSSTSKQAS